MKADVICKFIENCEFQEATIHYKDNNSQLFGISGVSDVDSSSQAIYLDAGHDDEQNLSINGSKLIELLREMDNYSCRISILEGYYPNTKNKVLEINHVRIDLMNDGSRQIHLISEMSGV